MKRPVVLDRPSDISVIMEVVRDINAVRDHDIVFNCNAVNGRQMRPVPKVHAITDLDRKIDGNHSRNYSGSGGVAS